MSFLGKHRQGKPPVIQKSIARKLFNPMMKGWLKTEQFCQKSLKSQPASIIEAFNSSCVNSMNVIKAGFDKLNLLGVFEFSNFLKFWQEGFSSMLIPNLNFEPKLQVMVSTQSQLVTRPDT